MRKHAGRPCAPAVHRRARLSHHRRDACRSLPSCLRCSLIRSKPDAPQGPAPRTGRRCPGARGLRRHEGCCLGRRQVRRSLLRRVRPGRGPAAHHRDRHPAPEGRTEPDARGTARKLRHASAAGARLLHAQGADRRRGGARRGLRVGHPPAGRRLAAARRPGDALAAAGRDLAGLPLLGEPAAMRVDFKVSADAAGQRLDKFLRKRLDNLPLSHLYKLVRTKKVRVNGSRAAVAQLLQPGDEITVHVLQAAQGPPPKPAASVRQDFRVLYEDEHLLAVDKPAGLAVHPGSGISGDTLVDQVRAYLARQGRVTPEGEFKPSPAHRLDRETSGVVIVAKTRQPMVRPAEMVTAGDAKKTYLALAKGRFQRERGTVDLRLAEHQQTMASKEQRGVNLQEAVTHWTKLAGGGEATLLEVSIETGRTHQIRRHLAAIGHPVVGDAKYGDFTFNRRARSAWGARR